MAARIAESDGPGQAAVELLARKRGGIQNLLVPQQKMPFFSTEIEGFGTPQLALKSLPKTWKAKRTHAQNFEFQRPLGAPGQCPGASRGVPGGPRDNCSPGQLLQDRPGVGPGTPRDAPGHPGQPVAGGFRDNPSRGGPRDTPY